jgi:ABC-type Co2+ transport system permease subunit
MMIPLIVLCLVVLAVSTFRLRRRGSRRLFVIFAVLTAALTSLSLAAALVALTAGRGTWNSWVSGTPDQETVTLTVLVVGLPLLLGIAVLSAIISTLSRRRHS